MFVNTSEIYTHLYPETIRTISGEDELMLTSAIKAAISEVKMYLHAYDLNKLFGATGDDRDDALLLWVKNVAVWHYIVIANPNVDYEARERRYKYTIATLKEIQSGDAVPDGFPPKTDEDGNKTELNVMKVGSNPAREQHI